VNVRKESNFRP